MEPEDIMKLGNIIIYVEDVGSSMDFYEKAFGLQKGYLHHDSNYGEMNSGETKLSFVKESFAMQMGLAFKPNRLKDPPAGVEITLITEHVDKAFTKALDAGATVVMEPAQKPWGQSIAYVRDLNGFLVEIGSPTGR